MSRPPDPGSATASGACAISGFRSSTSNTRSKLTSAVITWTCAADSEVIGPYTRTSSVVSATSVPSWKLPLMASEPPRPYTTAVTSEASRVRATTKTCPYMDCVTLISRTRSAREANIVDSCGGRPNSFTSIAPATLNRSVMVEAMWALSCIDSRVSRCIRRPTSRAGMRNTGIIASAITVTSQDR